MKPTANTCDRQIIDQFLSGVLDQTASGNLDRHLEDCTSCREYLETNAADAQTWTDIGGFLRRDDIDQEDFLMETGYQSTKNIPQRVQNIIGALTPSEFPEHLGRIGIYEVTGVVGAGSTGVVLKAIDPSLDRTVAIKVLSPVVASSEAARKRFERESKAAAAVIHPNVVPIHGVSSEDRLSWIVMAFAGGESLQNRLTNHGPMDTVEVLRIGSQIAAGLAAAHDQGLVHRDIKPANIIMEENVERIAITDFGLARAVDDASITREGVIAGTPRYMSPEQTQGKSVTQQTDLFSLGSVLYATATGRPPFVADSSFAVMRKICEEQPVPVRELNPDIPDWLEATIEKLMAKEPEDRFESSGDVAALLESALAHAQQPTNVPLPGELKKLARLKHPIVRHRKVIIMTATLFSVLATIGILMSAFSSGGFLQDFNSTAKEYPAVALFENAKVDSSSGQRQLLVFHDGEWLEAVSIGGVASSSIFEFAEKNVGASLLNKRVIEDLPVLFQMMKKPLTIPTPVELKKPDGSVFSANITATKANRVKLMEAQVKQAGARIVFRQNLNDRRRVALFPDAKVKSESGQRQLHVFHDDAWHKLIQIDDVTTQSVFDFLGEKLDTDGVNRRIVEDLPVVFKMMGKPWYESTLVKLEAEDGTVSSVKVTASKETRRELIRALRDRPIEFASLSADIEYFADNLEKRFAYFEANEVDLKSACAQLMQKYPNGTTPSVLLDELDLIMASYIDGHARVRHPSRRQPKVGLPFLIEPSGDRFVAFFENRQSFVDERFPYVTKIDGVPVEKLVEPLEAWVAKGSPQYQLRHKLRGVRDLGKARELSKIKPADLVRVELANEQGDVLEMKLQVRDRTPIYGIWPRTESAGVGKIENNLGYLRIARMDGDAKNCIGEWMPKFAGTEGLIVDVRDNGGGTREALIELARHLMKPDDAPRIANVCKYRLFKRHKEDHLESRFAYRADSSHFDDVAKNAIQEFAKTFQPQWEPAREKFSEWHYLVVSNGGDRPAKFYDKPVVILMNEKCFSATDIFLGAFKGWSNVTLVGQPSGGGSACTEGFSLPHSECRVSCASMASFQPNGKLYDGNGVEPDVVVQPTAGYFLRGGKDPFMAKAIELIRSGSSKENASE